MSKEAIVQSIVSERLVKANETKVQQIGSEDFKVSDKVDVYRPPSSKGTEGWTGPHELIHIAPERSKAVALVKSLPLLIPIRHIRLHTYIAAFIQYVMTKIYHAHNAVMTPSPKNSVSDEVRALVA